MGTLNTDRRNTGRSRSSRRSGAQKNTGRGGAVYGSSRMRAVERRKRRIRRRRMMIGGIALLIILVLGSAGYGIVQNAKNKEKQELLEAGVTCLDSGDYEAAIRNFEQELELAGSRIGSWEEAVLLYRAEAEYQLQDFEAALHTYEILLKEDKDSELYRKGAALCRMETGDYAGALELGVLDAQVYNRMAKAQIESGQYDEALAAIELGLEAAADDAVRKHLEFQKAVAYEYKSDYQKALELFEAYAEQFGPDEETQREITFLKTRQGQY